MKCEECKGKMKEEKFDIFDTGITTKGWVCLKCGNMHFDPLEAKKAINSMKELEKEKPLLVLKRRITSLAENRLGVYFPKDIVDSLHLRKGQQIRIYPADKDTIVMKRL